MRRHAAVVLAAVSLLAGAGVSGAVHIPKPGGKGIWEVRSLEVDGKKYSKEELKGVTLICDARGKVSVRRGDKAILGAALTLHPRKKPKAIDATLTEGEGKGKTALGIYEIKGESYRVCFARSAAKRPTEFSAKAGSGQSLIVIVCKQEGLFLLAAQLTDFKLPEPIKAPPEGLEGHIDLLKQVEQKRQERQRGKWPWPFEIIRWTVVEAAWYVQLGVGCLVILLMIAAVMQSLPAKKERPRQARGPSWLTTPVWERVYEASASGAVVKSVRCESCHAEYVYQLERTVTGSATTSWFFFGRSGAIERASALAKVTLDHALQEGMDVVPCPACGWYQPDMIPEARRQHRRWMLHAGTGLLVGLIPVGLIAGLINGKVFGLNPGADPVIAWPLFTAGLVFISLVGIALLIAKLVLASRYDPNREDSEARKRLGRSRAMLREEFENQAELKTQENVTP
jgi:uncharacterized protein (TIGR03067 family)